MRTRLNRAVMAAENEGGEPQGGDPTPTPEGGAPTPAPAGDDPGQTPEEVARAERAKRLYGNSTENNTNGPAGEGAAGGDQPKPEGEGDEPKGEGDGAPNETQPPAENAEVDRGAVPAADEPYVIETPEGVEIDQALLDAFTPGFKEQKLTHNQVQEMADAYIASQQSMASGRTEAFNAQRDAWEAELRADPQIGGDRFDDNITRANQFIDRHGDDTVKNLLDNTGLGSHPALVRFLVKAANAVREDSPPQSDGTGRVPVEPREETPEERAARLYSKSRNKN